MLIPSARNVATEAETTAGVRLKNGTWIKTRNTAKKLPITAAIRTTLATVNSLVNGRRAKDFTFVSGRTLTWVAARWHRSACRKVRPFLRRPSLVLKQLLKIRDSPRQVVLECEARPPAKQLLRERNVRLVLLRIVLWQSTMKDFRS